MIVIVDGIDRTGKTTLCQNLSKELGIPILEDKYRHLKYIFDNKKEKEAFFFGYDTCLSNVVRIFDNFILDRFLLSIIVFQRFFFRERTRSLKSLEEDLMNKARLILLSNLPYEEYYKRKEENDNWSESEYYKIERLFQDVFSETRVLKTMINASLSKEEVLRKSLKFIAQFNQ